MALPAFDELFLSDPALAAAYLRRLGFGEEEAASLSTSKPFTGNARPQEKLLGDLIRRHILRIPFTNLEQHSLPGCELKPTSIKERLSRLGNIRQVVSKLACGHSGGVCFDINPAFAWLLRQLGASVRLSVSAVATADGGFNEVPAHVVLLVTLTDKTLLVDPGFGDPVPTAIKSEGETVLDVASYQIVDNAVDGASRFSKVLQCKRQAASLCRHLWDPDNGALDGAEAEWTSLYAFRPEDDLAYDAEELRVGLEFILTPGKSIFAQKRFVCLALPAGYLLLSESRKRCAAGGVVDETPVDSDEAWWKEAASIFGLPLLKPPPPDTHVVKCGKPPQAASQWMNRAQASRDSAAEKTQNFGTVEKTSLLVGGAGSGGGLGLNAPGFGPKVHHYAAKSGSSGTKTVEVDENIKAAWAQVMNDSDPVGWLFCQYSSDGKKVELTNKGEGGLKDFKAQLGDAIAWGGFRCLGVDKRGDLMCKRPKFIFVQYKPEKASAMKKAKQGSHKGDIKEALAGAHLDLLVETLDDLDEQLLITKLQAATGAHKPNGYEFEEGLFLEADYYGLGIGKKCRGESTAEQS